MNLCEKDNDDFLSLVQESTSVRIHFVRQAYPLGLVHAGMQAKAFVGDELLVVMLGDDLIALAKQLINTYNCTHASNITVMAMPREETSKYGIIDIASEFEPGFYNVSRFGVKSKAEKSPNNLAIIDNYLLTLEIFENLENQNSVAGGEIQLTDAIDTLNQTQRVFAKRFEGTRYDVGDKFGFMTTSINYGLTHPEVKDKLKDFIIALGKELSRENENNTTVPGTTVSVM